MREDLFADCLWEGLFPTGIGKAFGVRFRERINVFEDVSGRSEARK